jgi:hypothetical protein
VQDRSRKARCGSELRSEWIAARVRLRIASPTGRSRSVAGCQSSRTVGQLGEAYIHGMNGFAEGVCQLRGTSVNQVDNVEHVLVTAGTGVPTLG